MRGVRTPVRHEAPAAGGSETLLSLNTDASIRIHVAARGPTRKVCAHRLAKECRAAIQTEQGRARRKMDRHAQTYVLGALHADGDDDTIEVRILRPHEAYRKTRGALAQDAADESPTDVQEVLR